ncbi:hypothetical protein D9611_004970 [Ephemerocybe angulata]|uniref:Hydrophobin n=1 Tax=Ephemerocybe angulata TaxID=980116 RepID=A0A8H5B2N1_9AGAR|nr:hypothetical protein D9611_004970 [Tulosesus angulatus]
MFARVTAATIALALALPMAIASPTPLEARTDQCSTGPVQCCQTTHTVGSSGIGSLVGGLALVGSVGDLIGLTCSPLTLIGVSGNSCTGQTVCCNNNNFNGVVALGCTPVNVNL